MATKDYSLQLNGGLDTRSADGACGPGWFRLLVNVDGSEPFQMCALGGWRRRMWDAACQNNQDLHDQLVDAQFYHEAYSITVDEYSVQTGTAYFEIPVYRFFPESTTDLCRGTYYLDRSCRESITYLQSVTSLSGTRRLLAGTHSRVYVSDDRGGNWRIIADGLGGSCLSDSRCDCSPVRMKGASLGDFTVMTNGVDEVLYWQFDTGPAGCFVWSADYVQDLRTLNLSSAKGICEFAGLLFLWDVRMDNLDNPSRLLWSDFNAPLSWVPGGESIAGFHDFGKGERIIACVPISGRLRVYTTQAIYDGQIVQSEETIAFVERYRLPGGTTSNLPAFRNGIANCGDYHIFVGQDDVYKMAVYDTEPIALDWMHRASGIIYEGLPEGWICGTDDITVKDPINRAACDALICRWSGRYKCVIISWPTGTSTCPDTSLWMWPETRKASVVNYGFTEITEHQPDDGESWRDFFGRMGVCDPAESLVEKEGESCPVTFTPLNYNGLWNATEDLTLPRDPDSVAALFCGMCMEDLCRICVSDTKLVMASASDKTLKEFTPDDYAREELISIEDVDFPTPDIGEYRDRPYKVLVQADAEMKEGPRSKTFRKMNVGFSLGENTEAPTLCASVAGGFSPGCMEWESQGQPMQCGGPNPKRRNGIPLTFGFYTEGVWLAWRLSLPATEWCGVSIDYRVELKGCW